MADDKKEHIDLTEEASKRQDSEATAVSRQAESEDIYEGPELAATPSPESDISGENRVTTSISEN